jgi:small subunit ribosomal protein S27Ae
MSKKAEAKSKEKEAPKEKPQQKAPSKAPVEKVVEKAPAETVEKAEEARPEKAEKAPKPQKKRKEGKKIFTLYKIEGEKAARLRPTCERCGPGYFMADHGNRYSCGHCGFTRYKPAEK